ncbi:MAG: PSD1 and planctomycete cytochrome C domain-containing protein [Armatimonadota bacterium]|nr:PSD1 and planctomycete cytochrome C domain-containing protein [Armatimonadota bacterium]
MLACLIAGLAGAACADAAKAEPSATDVYEKKVRPILADNCYSCHGPSKQVAGVRLDTKAGLLKSTSSGPLIVPNTPAKSALVHVIQYNGEVQMPPRGKMKKDEIDTIVAWIKAGAPWPGAGAAKTEPAKGEAAKVETAKDTTAAKTVAAHEKMAEKLDPQVVEFFETKVRPVLASNCFTCHGPEKQRAGLRLDTKAGVLKGSDAGPIIVNNDPTKSPLIQAIQHTGAVKMPLGGAKLKPHEIEALTEWVKMGVPWPGAEVSQAALTAAQSGDYVITDAQRGFWSFQPVRNYAPPQTKNGAWATSPIDKFILAKLEARGLKPNKAVDRRTLIRRATYDLTGLPPTPSEVDDFVQDKAPDAFAKVVDRLLASPQYGERWGRHWLDIARYADTKGYVFQEDRNYPHAYNYRDWVIKAFNEDLPYDQFIMQQLAADRLELGEKREALAALGFLTVGRRFLNAQPDIIDDRIDVTMRGFQGLSVSCARCHDHKFDPIPTKDYYSLYGVFANSVEPPPAPISPKEISDPWAAHDQKVREAQAEQEKLIREQVTMLRERHKKDEPLPDPVKNALQKVKEKDLPKGEMLAKMEPAFETEAREELKSLNESLATLRKSYPPAPELAMTLADKPQPGKSFVFRRGNPRTPGDEVPRRFLAVLSAGERPVWTQGSGRLELARAIASKDNPMTARVMANRIWQHHFGAGLVRTPSDFGKQGEPPTHPELLDYLARRFMDGGWSIKKMHRLIMLSSAYQQSSDYDAKNFTADPENRLIWRMNRRRLELEALRDSILVAARQLDPKVGGPSVELWKSPYTTRRTVYGFIERQNLPGIFRTFDFASPDSTNSQRFRTTVPQQALFLMNNDFVVKQARHIVSRPDLQSRADDESRIRYLYYILFGRAPDAEEMALGLDYLKEAAAPSTPQHKEVVWRYGYGEYDENAQRVTSFTALPVFKDDAYRGGQAFPDPTLSFLQLTAVGGHAGADAKHAAIRRWVAPQDGVVSIKGTLGHANENGDGVEARLVSSRDGSLGVWTAHNSKTETNVEKVTVQKGDTLDFVISCRQNQNFDSFTWSNIVTLVNGSTVWNSTTQFSEPAEPTPPLSAWERYAQALLMTNEFFFVD